MLRTLEPTLQARAQAAFAKSPISALREIVVEQEGDTLTLFGSVDTFYHKQMAQELLRELAGDQRCHVINCVEVAYDEDDSVTLPR